MTPDQTSSILKGSLATGAGVGVLAALYDALRSERRRTKALQGAGGPGTLDLYLPPQKQAVFAEALAGVATATGAAYVVQNLYKKWKAEQLKRETQDAAMGYLTEIGKEANDKTASGGAFSFQNLLTSIPRDLALIAPLAAAGGTYGMLEHAFPRVKEKRKPGAPRKIVIRGYGPVAMDGPGNGPLAEADRRKVESADPTQEQLDKAAHLASFTFGDHDRRRAAESFCLLVTAMPQVKDASAPLVEMLGHYMQQPEGTVEMLKQSSVLALVSASKGCADHFYAAPLIEKRAAIHSAMCNPLLAPALSLAAIAEFNEHNPTHAKMAKEMVKDPLDELILTKYASEMHLLDTASCIARQPNHKFASDWQKEMATLDVSEAEDTGGAMNDADTAYQGQQDPIDSFLAGQKA